MQVLRFGEFLVLITILFVPEIVGRMKIAVNH